MKTRSAISIFPIAIITLALVVSASPQNKAQDQTQKQSPASEKDEGVPGTVEGLVRDIACPMQNKRASATEFNLDCALECAKAGSPLIILTKAGLIYTPMSDSMPDKSQRDRLMPFVGKYVKATGVVYEREGAHAIVIKEITEMKDVHLITDAK